MQLARLPVSNKWVKASKFRTKGRRLQFKKIDPKNTVTNNGAKKLYQNGWLASIALNKNSSSSVSVLLDIKLGLVWMCVPDVVPNLYVP